MIEEKPDEEVVRFMGKSLPEAIPFERAVYFSRAKRVANDIDWIVLHAMDGAELDTKAETVSLWFAGKDPKQSAPRASFHYAIDSNSIVQSVLEKDVAWHAPGANHNGIGIEHAGRAKQTREEWLDAFSRSMLLISAGLVARLCHKYGLPMLYVDPAGLLAGKCGITTHHDVTKAFKRSTHVDPGKGFPMDWYLEQVRYAYGKLV